MMGSEETMMALEFAKLHGLGNDFVFIDDLAGDLVIDERAVIEMCDRHFGIGADGVILVRPSTDPECIAYMHYINSDGTLAQMCGNGVRCFAKFLVDRGYVPEDADSLVAGTLAGPKRITFTRNDDGLLEQAIVDMGEPVLDPAHVPTTLGPTDSHEGIPYVREASTDSPWGDDFSFTCISMGNPHAVCFIDDMDGIDDDLFIDPTSKSLDTLDLQKVGSFFESDPIFPEKANIEFAVVDDGGISMRVFERGCGETLACGTGACATGVAAYLTGRSGRSNTVHLKGGDLQIDLLEDGHVLMTGPAEESFSGTWPR